MKFINIVNELIITFIANSQQSPTPTTGQPGGECCVIGKCSSINCGEIFTYGQMQWADIRADNSVCWGKVGKKAKVRGERL